MQPRKKVSYFANVRHVEGTRADLVVLNDVLFLFNISFSIFFFFSDCYVL